MKRRLFVIVLAVVMVLGMLPASALALTGPTYNTLDFNKMQAFLEQEDGSNVKNGVKLNAAYDKDDPTTWTDVEWSSSSGDSMIVSIGAVSSWEGRGLVGSLDLSGLSSLMVLHCYDNSITGVDLSGCTSLAYLGCEENAVTAIDVTGCTGLIELWCGENQLSSLNVSQNTNLEWLLVYDNNLTTIDVSACTKLKVLDVSENSLTSVDISMLPNLWGFGCEKNDLGSIDLCHNPLLEIVYASAAHLDTLDLSSNPLLATLDCGSNNLSMLDLSSNLALERLVCVDNNLSSLDLSANVKLVLLDCGNNPMTAIKASSADGAIDLSSDGDGYVSIYVNIRPSSSVSLLDRYSAAKDISEPDRDTGDIMAIAMPIDSAGFVEWTGTLVFGRPEDVSTTDLSDGPYQSSSAQINLIAGADYTLKASFVSITPSREDKTVYQDGRLTLTPNIPGGTWSFDETKVSGEAGEGDALVLTGIVAGVVRVTYTLPGDPAPSSYIDITVSESDLPSTGQDFTMVFVLIALALAAMAAAFVMMRKRRARA